MHIVTVPTMVRKEKCLDSEMIGGLAPGTPVTIRKISGLRVHISEPFNGWISSHAQNGVQILLKMREEQFEQLLANPKQFCEKDQAFFSSNKQDLRIYPDSDEKEIESSSEIIMVEETKIEKKRKKGFIGQIKKFASSFSGSKKNVFDFGDERQTENIIEETHINLQTKTRNSFTETGEPIQIPSEEFI